MDSTNSNFHRTNYGSRRSFEDMLAQQPEDTYSSYPEVSEVRKNLPPLNEILKNISVKEFLISDAAAAKEEEKDLLWFHGRITRETAIHILKENGDNEGLFLVRESTSVSGDFVVSLVHERQPQHFQIHCLGDFYYQIDNGPLFQGLDHLINFYKEGANGLPTILKTFCKGTAPPPISRRLGRTTPLHRAVAEKVLQYVKQILDDPLCGSLDARNANGDTALHEAAAQGDVGIVETLIDHGANVNSKNCNSTTPLYTACVHNQKAICRVLMRRGADPTLRHPRTGWVPLHEAATRGHTACIQEIVTQGAPLHPRNVDNDTPLDLARRYEQNSTITFLKTYEAHKPKTTLAHWFHGEMDRSNAMEHIQRHGAKDGQFLVRTSTHHPGVYVLSMAAGGSVYNFEILKKGELFYIDDGPYFKSLEQVMDHYLRFEDGLPTKLTQPIKPSRSPEVIAQENESRFRNDSDAANRPPMLGPRPPDLVSPPPSRSDSPAPPGSPPQREASLPSSPPPEPPSQKPNNNQGSHSPSGVQRILSTIRGKTASKKELERQKKELQQAMNEAPGGAVENDVNVIDIKTIHKGREIGQGEFGSVLEGTWKDSKGHKYKVALKTLHQDQLQTGKKEFLREAKVMCGLDHACIVKLLGVCMGPPLMLVQQLVSMGSLLDFLIDHSQDVSEYELKLWAAQIACGMMYLEHKKFVHRDLAARNILLASKEQAKISDFGLSRATGEHNDYYRATTGGRWPVKWYAPESIYFGTFSHASDVWSYGVTLWEMYTYGDQPYGEMMGAEVIKQIEDGKRLSQPDGCPQKVYEIMMRCWSYKPNRRPTFQTLNQTFGEDPEYSDFYHAGIGINMAPSKRVK
ncbi:tyrosine-protein kinase HTK16-like isoform X2 [Amphiura filiformis]|uniref:tyrosine-protein kinase HTK16-like isoform X2 n=1 Tax=Amphiura filiformis TaxID=82378 RepID=UPI003B2286F1